MLHIGLPQPWPDVPLWFEVSAALFPVAWVGAALLVARPIVRILQRRGRESRPELWTWRARSRFEDAQLDRSLALYALLALAFLALAVVQGLGTVGLWRLGPGTISWPSIAAVAVALGVCGAVSGLAFAAVRLASG